jgi:hypothetical protein
MDELGAEHSGVELGKWVARRLVRAFGREAGDVLGAADAVLAAAAADVRIGERLRLRSMASSSSSPWTPSSPLSVVCGVRCSRWRFVFSGGE